MIHRDISQTCCQKQQAIRAKCFHAMGTFIEFDEEEVEQSIQDRFEKIVSHYPDRLAARTKNGAVTYDERLPIILARVILTRRGQGQEPVALFVKDSARFITAHLAVLKAGKFSLGLDPLQGGRPTFRKIRRPS